MNCKVKKYYSNLVKISKELISCVKINHSEENEYRGYLKTLQTYKYENLVDELKDNNLKMVFWINIYNSFILINLQNEEKRKIYPQWKFFGVRDITISNMNFSFNDIEHKLLRKSQFLIWRGFLSRFDFIVPKIEKELRVDIRDYRIHFALNCGAESCPPILFYDENKINQQLDIAERNFIKSDSVYDKSLNILRVSKIFFWYLGDFGGIKGIIKIHKDIGIVPRDVEDKTIKLIYNYYNWEIV